MIRKVHDKARVHFSLITVGFTIVGLVWSIVSAKSELRRGESIEKRSIERQREYNEKFNKT